MGEWERLCGWVDRRPDVVLSSVPLRASAEWAVASDLLERLRKAPEVSPSRTRAPIRD